MRKLLCILALATTLHAQANPDFVALDKELHQLQAQDKTATQMQLAKNRKREDEILKSFNAPPNAKWEAYQEARQAAWIAKKNQERKDFCTAHPQEKSCK